jgi:hypothetical protein
MTENTPHRRHRISLFFPILLIALGVVFLLKNMGVLQGDTWSLIINLWPVLLIVIGIDQIWRREGSVGAVFWIGAGIVFLLSNFGYLNISIWQAIFGLWPVLLVAIGFDILGGRRSIWVALVGSLVVLALMAGSLYVMGAGLQSAQALPGEQVTQPLNGATQASVDLAPAAGSLHVYALPGGDNLVEGTVATASGEHATHAVSTSGGTMVFSLHSTGTPFFLPNATQGRYNWNIGLSPQVPIDLKAAIGAGNMDIDLSGLQISNLQVDVAVGSATVTLPEKGRFQAKMSGAVGQLVVIVPRGMQVRIQADNGLVGVSAPAGYQQQGKVYTSPGYAGAENAVDLQISQAIGQIVIKEK